MIPLQVFREYDIRGIAGRELDGGFARAVGCAFGTYVRTMRPQARRVSVGRDARLSSDDLVGHLAEGLLSTGLDVCDLGVCTTPVQYFSLFHLDLDGGVMVTGSHNPAEYNGFKLSVGRDTIHGDAIKRLRSIIFSGSYLSAPSKGTAVTYDMVSEYKAYMLKEFSYLSDPRYRRIKIVVDAGNGTAGLVAPDILSGMGCDVVPLYCEPDGRFPNHHPDPTVPENIRDLQAETVRSGADIGVGYDGDADRIGAVDGRGSIIWGDHLMILLSRDVLQDVPGAKIIGDVKCSQLMFDEIARRGGVPVMWKTGHSLIKQKMRDEGALMAGEFSGHIFIKHRYFGFDDAVYATLRVVEIMKRSGKDLRTLLADVPKLCHTPEIRLECPDELKLGVVARVVERFSRIPRDGGVPFPVRDVCMIDGARVLFDKGWCLIRASNTQPVVVMRVEAEDEEMLAAYREMMEKELMKAMAECR